MNAWRLRHGYRQHYVDFGDLGSQIHMYMMMRVKRI
jgi:hypothetical protein